MFKFKRILNAATCKWYYIESASLASDEPDWTQDGGNAYYIDLQPLEWDGQPILALTLSISNNDAYAMITKNLDRAGSTHEIYDEKLQQPIIREDMQDCIIYKDLLIVTTD